MEEMPGLTRILLCSGVSMSHTARIPPVGWQREIPLLTKRVFSTRGLIAGALVGFLVLALWPAMAMAHNVSKRDATFVQANKGAAIGPFLYLGAKHMVTGYDHILFLVGVIFFLYRLKDIVTYVSLFTLGHSITLLAGVFGGLHANPFIIDAIIGASVVYKAFDNMGGFQSLFGFQPN